MILQKNGVGVQMEENAAIFINWMIPVGMGHVGWGFRNENSQWWYGGLETAGVVIGKGQPNNTNNSLGTFKEMIKNMKGMERPGMGRSGYPYHEYKLIKVKQVNLKKAHDRVSYIRKDGYGLRGNNCMDAVFNVIKAYANGNDNILPWPSKYWAPRWWYCAIDAYSNVLQDQSKTGNWLEQHAPR